MIEYLRKPGRSDKGFTLIEVMVAITLLMIVVLPLASLYVKSLSTIQNASLYSQAIILGRSRIELMASLDYDDLDYTNPIFCPGFPFEGDLLPYYQTNGAGNPYDIPEVVAYDNRDNDQTNVLERYFDPTGNGGGETYPVPVYRDYYNNFTGELIDPNYNGLCDDDLNGDGVVTTIDEYLGNPNGELYNSGPFNGQSKAGDGIYDTVVEGMYTNSFDITQWRQTRTDECVSPLIDFGLQLDRNHNLDFNGGSMGVVRDFRHREKTYQYFVRMTSIIDPTPRLANPHHPDAFDDWVDQLYFRNRRFDDGYSDKQLLNLSLCLERDIPLMRGMNNLTVAIGSDEVTVMEVDEGAGLQALDPFKTNYSTPLYGKKVVVTVFYISGSGENVYIDLDGDGIPEQLPSETYASAKRVSFEKIFVNDTLLKNQGRIFNREVNSSIEGLAWDSGNTMATAYNIRLVPPERRFIIDLSIPNPTPERSVTLPDLEAAETDDPHDPCSDANDGLPYLSTDYWFR